MVAQPPLPDRYLWPKITQDWWNAWGDDPRTEACSLADWNFLAGAALLHAQVWQQGDITQVTPLRQHERAFMQRLDRYADMGVATASGDEQHGSQALTMLDKYRKSAS